MTRVYLSFNSLDKSYPSFNREDFFQKSTNQKQKLPVAAMFVNGSGRNEQSLQRTIHRCFLPSFGSFGQVVSEEKIFLNRPIRNKNCLWWPCLSMDRDEMSNLFIRPSIDASYKISDQLALWFQRRRLKCEKLTDDVRGHIFRFPSVAFIYRFDCTKYKCFPCLPFSGYLYMYCSPGYLYRYCSPLQQCDFEY